MQRPTLPPHTDPQLISFKVLRASRPSFSHSVRPYFEDETIAGHGKALYDTASKDLGSNQRTHSLGVGIRDDPTTSVLSLPSNFGVVSLGETFTVFISLTSVSPTLLHTPNLTVSLQTSSVLHVVPVLPPLPQFLRAGETYETVIGHDVKELGSHSLICSVSYTVNGEERSFKKTYKFQVSNPLSVRTKVHTPKNPNAVFDRNERHKIYLEVQVSNISPTNLQFQSLYFEPFTGLVHEDVNTKIFDHTSEILYSGDVRQYLYILLPTPGSEDTYEAPIAGSQNLGRLDITWRFAMGDIGRLQTSQLTRKIQLGPIVNISSQIPSSRQHYNLPRQSAMSHIRMAQPQLPENGNMAAKLALDTSSLRPPATYAPTPSSPVGPHGLPSGVPLSPDSPISTPMSPFTPHSVHQISLGRDSHNLSLGFMSRNMSPDNVDETLTERGERKEMNLWQPSVEGLTVDLVVDGARDGYVGGPFQLKFHIRLRSPKRKRRLRLLAQFLNFHPPAAQRLHQRVIAEQELLSPLARHLLETLHSPMALPVGLPSPLPSRPGSAFGSSTRARRMSASTMTTTSVPPPARDTKPHPLSHSIKRKDSSSSLGTVTARKNGVRTLDLRPEETSSKYIAEDLMSFTPNTLSSDTVLLPPAHLTNHDGMKQNGEKYIPSREVRLLGPTIVLLGDVDVFNLQQPPANEKDLMTDEPSTVTPVLRTSNDHELSWTWSFVSRSQGLMRVGGVRLLVLNDWEETVPDDVVKSASVLAEWNVIREVWISSACP